MGRVIRSAAALAVAGLATGCTSVVGGAVRPGPGLTPQPVTGAAVRLALLDDVALAKLLDKDFRSDPGLQPRFGAADALPDGWRSGRPSYCVGTVVGAQQVVYRTEPVHQVAQEFWGGVKSARSPLTGVAEGVIALPTTADAQVAFERFAAQWNRCRGITVTRAADESAGITGASAEIGDVQTGGSVITASVRITLSGGVDLSVTRALGVRVNCLVDVDVFSIGGGSVDGADKTGALDVARAMMDKVSALAP